MTSRDRRTAVLQSSAYNGIDFVEVANPEQTTLNVHFLNAVELSGTLSGQPTILGGETIPSIAVLPIADTDWSFDDGHVELTLRVAAPGDFSTYTLAIPSPVLDRFFDRVVFSFKAGCPSDLDCERAAPPCPLPVADVPPINYLAKDFLSFRQALLDFSALRYPQWQERSEADFGVMFLEALSALADDLSYTQDRIAAEATLATATQRRSMVRHARLVDYEPTPALSSNVMLRFDVADGVSTIPDGVAVTAPAPGGEAIAFETGSGLRTRLLTPTLGGVPASALWNAGRILPYWFDDSERCLKAGATEMIVLGRGFDFQPGQLLLIETAAASTADPPLRQIVQLLDAGDASGSWADEECDELFLSPVTGDGPPWLTCPVSPPATMAPTAVTRIRWRAQDRLTTDRDLTRTVLAGNIAPATQGRTVQETFVIGEPAEGDTAPGTIVRTGARALTAPGVSGNPTPMHLFTLANAPIAWLPQPTLDPSGAPLPEILLLQQNPAADPTPWSWFRRLLDAGEFDLAFTLDAAHYARIARNSDNSVQYDYDGDAGDTIRFGDGSFGINPDNGTRFTAIYRFGTGATGNVAAGAISRLDAATLATGRYLAVNNPLPASGGQDAQTLQSVQRLAPSAFRAQQFRAVIAADYKQAAETLPWVQRAGTVFRWTGSWLTVFTTPDPLGSEQVTVAERTQLIALLNRYRMAGYESYVPDPQYVSLDLAIDVCATADAFAADVKEAIVAALAPPGFFAPDDFSFGQPLERSRLEAAIQAVPGVAGVLCVRVRVRGRAAGLAEMGDIVAVGTNQIVRCDNDPSRPENGALAVTVGGGR